MTDQTPRHGHLAASLGRALTMGAGEMTSKVAVAAAFMWLARMVRPDIYGQVEWALSMLTVATLAADAGLGTWAAAELGRRPDAADRKSTRLNSSH